jgi:hypothetical protein
MLADRVGEEPIAGAEGGVDGAGEDILGKDTLGEAVDVGAFDEDEGEAAAVDLVIQDDDVGAGPIT